MKSVIGYFVSAAVIGILSISALANPVPTYAPETVTVAADHVFLPPGFDDNDNTQIVISGNLYNTCYKIAPSQTRIDRENKKIYIRPQAYYYKSSWCLFVLVPYVQTLDLGILNASSYEVITEDKNNAQQSRGMLPIAVAKSAEPDDYLYAPIRDAYMEDPDDDTDRTLILAGTFPNSCMQMKEVKVLNRTQNIVEVFPIAEVKDNGNCNAGPKHFKEKVTLNTPWKGTTLIHIRSLNGQSINKVVEFQ